MEPQTQPALPTVPSQAVRWHAVTTAETIHRLGTDINSGLTETEARQRLAQVGPNRLREEKHESIWETVLEEVREPLILLLLFTGVLYSVFGEVTDALTIFFVIFTLMAIEVFNERRAEQAIAALHKLAEPTALVQRGGQLREIPAEELVPGDLILLEARRCAARGRLRR